MLALTLEQRPEEAAALGRSRYMSITTFRRDGRGVATPVEYVVQDGSYYVLTRADSGKVQRIRRERRVLISACTFRGKATGHKLAANASLLSPEESATLLPAFRARYGKLWFLLRKLRRPRTQGIRLDLD